jgi:hypothetical protein
MYSHVLSKISHWSVDFPKDAIVYGDFPKDAIVYGLEHDYYP